MPRKNLLPRHSSIHHPPTHPPPWPSLETLTFWKLRASRACVCRLHAKFSWASRSHSIHRRACRPLRSSCRRPRANVAATAHRLHAKCCQARKHLDSSCQLGMDHSWWGGGAVGLAPQPQGAAGGSAPPISPFPRLQRVGLPSVIGWPWKSQPRKPLEAGECSLLLLVPRASRPLPSRKEIPSPLILCGSAIRALSLSGLVSIHPGRGDRSWPRSVAPAPPHSHGLTALSRTPGSQCVGLCSWKTKGQDSSQAKKQAGQDTPAEPASPRPPFLRNGGVAA